MTTYDPDHPSDSARWLALGEAERLDLVQAFHSIHGGYGGSPLGHATLHVIVENQLAEDDPVEVMQALRRLTRAGLERLDSVHAIGAVLVEHLLPVLHAEHSPPEFDMNAYRAALAELSASTWRSEE